MLMVFCIQCRLELELNCTHCNHFSKLNVNYSTMYVHVTMLHVSVFPNFVGGTAPTPAVCKCLLGSHLSNFYPFVSCLQLLNLHHFIIPFTISHFWGPCCWRGQGSTKKKPQYFRCFFLSAETSIRPQGRRFAFPQLGDWIPLRGNLWRKNFENLGRFLGRTQNHHFFSVEKWTTFTIFYISWGLKIKGSRNFAKFHKVTPIFSYMISYSMFQKILVAGGGSFTFETVWGWVLQWDAPQTWPSFIAVEKSWHGWGGLRSHFWRAKICGQRFFFGHFQVES